MFSKENIMNDTINNISCSKTFSDGSHILNNYKYKKSYIFDNCQWLFIIMDDCTYFFNRLTEEYYFQPISPDSIEEVSNDYVFFVNENNNEKTLYSLVDKKAIICASNIVFFNKEALIWKNDNDITVYSLSNHTIIHKIKADMFFIDTINMRLLYNNRDSVYSCSLLNDFNACEIMHGNGKLITILNNELAIYYIQNNDSNCNNHIRLLKINDPSFQKEIIVIGKLAKINEEVFIDVNSRNNAFSNLDTNAIGIPDATIEAKYCEFYFYPCSWDIFYVQRCSYFLKIGTNFHKHEDITLKSINSDLQQPLKSFSNNVFIEDNNVNRFLLYNSFESFATSKNYSGDGYSIGGDIYIHHTQVLRHYNNCLTKLSKNGYWDERKKGVYNFNRYEKYGLIYDGLYRTYHANVKGEQIQQHNEPIEHIDLGKSIIVAGGTIFYDKQKFREFTTNALAISPKLNFSIIHKNDKLYILEISSREIIQEKLLPSISTNSI